MRFVSFLATILVGALALPGRAATIPYQGLATDDADRPVPDKEHEATFTLFGDSTGNKELWTETRLVSTRKGLFSLELGSKTPIPEKVLRSGDPFLAVNLGGKEIKPRLRLGRVPRAGHAIASDSASFASKVAGLEALVARVAAIESANAALSDRRIKDSSRIAQLERLLRGVTRTGQELVFDSLNVSVRNGLGKTDTVNGLGNLTIGYNELRGDTSDHRSGSHMMVAGSENSFTSFGGIVVGYRNSTTGRYASISGGERNLASDFGSSVSGGRANDATGSGAWVGGGSGNRAQGSMSAITGGNSNEATGFVSTVGGGQSNEASGTFSSIAGGLFNEATGLYSSVGGGRDNLASGTSSAVGGGSDKTVSATAGFAP